MTEFMKTYKLKITVLSPVHIGASADLEPTGYVIFSEKPATPAQPFEKPGIICPECGHKNPPDAKECGECGEYFPKRPLSPKPAETRTATDDYLYTFSPEQLSAALSDADKKTLLNEAKKGNLTALQRFFKSKASVIVKTATKRSAVCSKVAKEYNDKVGQIGSKSNDFNKFAIERQISDPLTELPYIPGSSLKGAIRTALMSAKNERRRLSKELYQKADEIEKTLYNYQDRTADPFKALKLQDGLASTRFFTNVCAAENVKRASGKVLEGKRGVSVYMEIIPEGAVFESSLSVMRDDAFPEDIESVRKACNDFYFDILDEQENKQVFTHGVSSAFFEKIQKMRNNPRTFLLCLGKHGGAESKTIDGLRDIKIVQGKGRERRQDHATTFWFANDGKTKLPFGWCVAEYEELK